MAPNRPPSSSRSGDISLEIDALRGRLDSVEKDVDRRFDSMEAKIAEQMRSSSSHHAELMAAISALTTRHELTDQRSSIHHESLSTKLGEAGKRIEALEQSRASEIQKMLDEKSESARHWLRYVITAGVTFIVGAGGWVLAHLIK